MGQVDASLTVTTRARAGLAAAEHRIQHGQPGEAARQVLTVIQDLLALHSTLLDTHVILGRQEHARAQLASDRGLQAAIERHREVRPARQHQPAPGWVVPAPVPLPVVAPLSPPAATA